MHARDPNGRVLPFICLIAARVRRNGYDLAHGAHANRARRAHSVHAHPDKASEGGRGHGEILSEGGYLDLVKTEKP